MNYERLSTAVHLAVNLGIAEGALDGDRNTQADVSVVGAGVDIRLKIGGQHDIDAAVTGANAPAGVYFGAGLQAGIDASVAGLYAQGVQAAVELDVSVA